MEYMLRYYFSLKPVKFKSGRKVVERKVLFGRGLLLWVIFSHRKAFEVIFLVGFY